MKANRRDYDDIYACVLYAAHCIFITIKDVYDSKQCDVIKHTKSACLPIIEIKYWSQSEVITSTRWWFKVGFKQKH